MEIIVSSKAFVPIHLKDFCPNLAISIVDPDDAHPTGLPENCLNLKFDDLTFEPKSDFDIARYRPPTKEMVKEIYLFGEKNINKDSKVLIHCFAGISRSSAAAIIALTYHLGWREAMDTVADLPVMLSLDLYKSGASCFLPNNLMIEYLDNMIYADGRITNYLISRFNY